MARILIADDDADIRNILCTLLENDGYEVEEATHGKEAIAKASDDYDLKAQAILQAGSIAVNPIANEVWKEGREIQLTELEYRILLLLMKNRGQIFTIRTIYETVWEEPYYYSSNNNVMVHIRNLRRKLEEDPENPKCIVNIWGKGYRFEQG